MRPVDDEKLECIEFYIKSICDNLWLIEALFTKDDKNMFLKKINEIKIELDEFKKNWIVHKEKTGMYERSRAKRN